MAPSLQGHHPCKVLISPRLTQPSVLTNEGGRQCGWSPGNKWFRNYTFSFWSEIQQCPLTLSVPSMWLHSLGQVPELEGFCHTKPPFMTLLLNLDSPTSLSWLQVPTIWDQKEAQKNLWNDQTLIILDPESVQSVWWNPTLPWDWCLFKVSRCF